MSKKIWKTVDLIERQRRTDQRKPHEIIICFQVPEPTDRPPSPDCSKNDDANSDAEKGKGFFCKRDKGVHFLFPIDLYTDLSVLRRKYVIKKGDR